MICLYLAYLVIVSSFPRISSFLSFILIPLSTRAQSKDFYSSLYDKCLNIPNKYDNQIRIDMPSALELLNIAKAKHGENETVISEQILPIYLTEESNWVKS